MSGGSTLLFKGSGFYITDYGKDGKKDQRKATDSGKGEASGSGGESSGKPPGEKKPSKGSGSSDA
jgi:predicted nucleic acid-binding Zn ribbon protein